MLADLIPRLLCRGRGMRLGLLTIQLHMNYTYTVVQDVSDAIQHKKLQIPLSTQATACCAARAFTSCQLVHVTDGPGGQVPQRLPTESPTLPPVGTTQLLWPPHCGVTHYQPISTPLVTCSVCMQGVCYKSCGEYRCGVRPSTIS